MLDDIETFMITGIKNVFPIVSHFIYLLIKGFAKVVRYIKKDKFRIFFVQNIFFFFFTNIVDSQDSRGRGRLYL